MESNWQELEAQKNETEAANNVVPIAQRLAAVAKAEHPEPYLSDAERREFREMLAWYRVTRREFQAIKTACPTARMMFED